MAAPATTAPLPLASLPRPRLLIGGELRGAADGAEFPIENPATGELIGHAPDAGATDSDAAISAARAAFQETAWATDTALRSRCLRQLKAALDADFETLRAITIAEAGVPRLWTDGPQLRMPVDGLDYLVKLVDGYEWEQDLGLAAPLGIRTQRRVCREPAGVVAAITPWNFPNQINLAKLGPALAAGLHGGAQARARHAVDRRRASARIVPTQTDIPPGWSTCSPPARPPPASGSPTTPGWTWSRSPARPRPAGR